MSSTKVQRSEAFTTYYGLDPSVPAETGTLMDVSQALATVDTTTALAVRASCWLEAAQEAGLRGVERRRFILNARAALTFRNNYGLAPQSDLGIALWAHLPVISKDWRGESSKLTAAKIGAILETSRAAVAGKDLALQGAERGQAFELVTILALAHTGIAGIRATPSLERQNSNKVLVEGRRYRWDVTTISDGSTIPAGEYRLQVKASYATGGYHKEIVQILGDTDLGVDTTSGDHVFEVGEQLVSVAFGDAPSRDIVSMRERLLARLCMYRPADTLQGGKRAKQMLQ